MTAPLGVLRSGPSTIRDLVVQRLGVPVAAFFNRLGNTFVAAPVVDVMKQDPTRVAFVLTNVSPFDFVIGPTRFGVTVTQGIKVTAFGGTAVADWTEDGEVIAEEWSILGIGGAGNYYLLEFLLVVGPGPGHGP